jgi:hypothetical protein
MKNETKSKQIVIRFDNHSYNKISDYAKIEHRGIGEFVRHAALYYIENFDFVINRKQNKEDY